MPPTGIDPRAPRFAAAITAALLAATVVFGVVGLSTRSVSAYAGDNEIGWFAYQPLADEIFFPGGYFVLPHLPISERAADPGFILLAIVTALFAWGVISPRTAPLVVIFRRFVAPRLAPPTELEDPRPPRFSQALGLAIAAIGVVLHLAGVPLAIPIAAGITFVATFLYAVFNFCLGCRMYVGLQRPKRHRTA